VGCGTLGVGRFAAGPDVQGDGGHEEDEAVEDGGWAGADDLPEGVGEGQEAEDGDGEGGSFGEGVGGLGGWGLGGGGAGEIEDDVGCGGEEVRDEHREDGEEEEEAELFDEGAGIVHCDEEGDDGAVDEESDVGYAAAIGAGEQTGEEAVAGDGIGHLALDQCPAVEGAEGGDGDTGADPVAGAVAEDGRGGVGEWGWGVLQLGGGDQAHNGDTAQDVYRRCDQQAQKGGAWDGAGGVGDAAGGDGGGFDTDEGEHRHRCGGSDRAQNGVVGAVERMEVFRVDEEYSGDGDDGKR